MLPPLALLPLSSGDVAYVWASLRRLGVAERELADVTHDVVVVACQHAGDFDRSRPLKPWLFGIAARVAANHRRLARHTREALVDGTVDVHDPREAGSAEQCLLAEDARRLVIGALAAVEPDRRAVLVMHDIDGVPIPEVAAALSIPLNTAYSRLRIGRDELRAEVKRERLRRGEA